MNNNLKFLFFNANGINHRLDDIWKFSNLNLIDILFVVETHHKKDFNLLHSCFSLPAFTGDSGGLIGGITVLCKNKLIRKSLLLKKCSKANLWMILQLDKDIIAVCYFPPSCVFKRHLLELLKELESISENWNLNVTLVGDFNARSKWSGDHLNTTRGNELKTILDDFPLEFLKPLTGKFTTANTMGGKGITDLLFSTHGSCFNYHVHEKKSLGGSDHRPLTWDLYDISIEVPSHPKWKFINFHKTPDLIAQYQIILDETKPTLSEFREQNIEQIQNEMDKDWSKINEWITYALENSCGHFGKFRNHEGMFWTPELTNQSQQVNDMANELNMTSATQRMQKRALFKRYAENRRKRHEELKRTHFDELCKSGNRGQFYRYVKKISREFHNCALNSNDMDRHTDHFKTTFGGTPSGSEQLIDWDALNATDSKRGEFQENHLKFNAEQVQAVVNKLGRNKASGEDNIPAEAFMFGGDPIVEILTCLFNNILKFHTCPTQWNHSLVCLIYKRKGDERDVKNYRPISLTIVAKRVFEKVLDSELTPYKSKLHDLQGGFRKNRSTCHQIYYLAELMKTNKGLLNVFLDLRAAYDTVDRRILWTILVKSFGMPFELVRLIRALFDHNESFLLVGSETSTGIPNLRGLPQGSALSPIIFNFFIDGLIRILDAQDKENELPSNCLFFADDGNLHTLSETKMQSLLDLCQTWSIEHGMTFAPEKSVVVASAETQVFLGDSELPQVTSCKYLGIPMTSTGPDWNSAANDMSKKAVAAVMTLRRYGFNQKNWCPSAKIDIYKLFVRSQMEYGMQVNIYKKCEIQMFEKAQQLSLRIAYGVPWNTSKTALKRLSCLESMECRNLLLNARFIRPLLLGTFATIPASRLFNSVLKQKGSLAHKWNLCNHYLEQLKRVSEKSMKTTIKQIRYENIVQDNLGHTNISDAIAVDKSLKHSAILYWEGTEDAKVKQELILWRLGRVAFHQVCNRCNGDLSRKHAVICSGAEDYILQQLPHFTLPPVNTIIDEVLNRHLIKGTQAIWSTLFEAIQGLRRTCLLQLV